MINFKDKITGLLIQRPYICYNLIQWLELCLKKIFTFRLKRPSISKLIILKRGCLEKRINNLPRETPVAFFFKKKHINFFLKASHLQEGSSCSRLIIDKISWLFFAKPFSTQDSALCVEKFHHISSFQIFMSPISSNSESFISWENFIANLFTFGSLSLFLLLSSVEKSNSKISWPHLQNLKR